MKRMLVMVLALAAVLPAAAVASPAPDAQLTGLACHSTLSARQRSVAIETVMRHVSGTRSLSVKLTLLERSPGQATAAAVPASGDLGVWLTPAIPTLGRRAGDVWKLDKTVYDVDAPARYRFSVEFRWLGAGGAVLRTETLRSAACAVTDLQADVLVRSVAVRPIAGHPARDRYVAVIANGGASWSGPFAVQFTADSGAAAVTRPVASLAPGAAVRVGFTSAACDASDPPVVVADPAGHVDDSNRANNTLTVTCPGS